MPKPDLKKNCPVCQRPWPRHPINRRVWEHMSHNAGRIQGQITGFVWGGVAALVLVYLLHHAR